MVHVLDAIVCDIGAEIFLKVTVGGDCSRSQEANSVSGC